MFPNHITYITVNSGDKGLKGGDHSCLITTKKNQTNQTELQPGDHTAARVGLGVMGFCPLSNPA